VLLAHDSDAFNRWEAGQKLALERLTAAVLAHGTQTLDDGFIAAMRRVLRHPDLDPAFKDLALSLPSEKLIAEQLEVVDPQRIHVVRERFRNQLASAMEADWVWAWENHQLREGYAATPQQAGRRALANRALAMLCLRAAQHGDAVWPGRAYQRFKDASNMTDRLGALSALVNSHAELAAPALERMFEIFKDDALVIDKWFAIQVGATEPLGERAGSVFAKALSLMKHPAYSLKNPNRARSVLSTLFNSNPAAFHRHDGAGYRLWADIVMQLDATNPRLAARFARAMDRWRTLAEPYRAHARAALDRVAAKADLSSDVREVVAAGLNNA
jgi:aminopeptidase N